MADQNTALKRRKVIQQATCAAILAASFAAPLPADANPVIQGASCASVLASSCALLKTATIEGIRKYCQTSWRQSHIPPQDWDDCTQDVIVELLNRLSEDEIATAVDDPGSENRRELMRSVWCVAQRWRRASKKQGVSLDQLADPTAASSVAVSTTSDFDLEKFELALEALNPTQRTIVSRVRTGDSVAEIADAMQLPAARVSDQKYKAVKKLQSVLCS